MDQGAGWWSFIRHDPERDKPRVSMALLRRVANYARPYKVQIFIMLACIVVIALLSVVPPLLYRNLIDVVIPSGNGEALTWVVVWMVAVPLTSGLVGVLQRFLGSR